MLGEKIIGAAVRLKTDHIVGKNHAECIKKLKSATEQGFIAQSGTCLRFVNRKEALEIAIEAGQNITKHPPMDKLLSEDLALDKFYTEGK